MGEYSVKSHRDSTGCSEFLREKKNQNYSSMDLLGTALVRQITFEVRQTSW